MRIAKLVEARRLTERLQRRRALIELAIFLRGARKTAANIRIRRRDSFARLSAAPIAAVALVRAPNRMIMMIEGVERVHTAADEKPKRGERFHGHRRVHERAFSIIIVAVSSRFVAADGDESVV